MEGSGVAMEPQKKLRLLVTGGTGFVGTALCDRLLLEGHEVRIPVRHARVPSIAQDDKRPDTFVTGDLTQFDRWSELVQQVDAVVHLVARTHVTDEFGAAAIANYRATNVDITRRLALASRQAGVRRFIYLSSIKAVANSSDVPLVETAPSRPVDSYGITKLEAEHVVRRQLLGSGTCYTILRPPLVYGPGVKGNFERLMRLVRRGIPLPGINNRRSMIHIDNLVDAICLCLQHPHAMDQTFHVSDGTPQSTASIIRHMAHGLDVSPRIIPTPRWLLRLMGLAIGKREETRRLADSLIVESLTARTRLDWQPRIDSSTGIQRTCRQWAQLPQPQPQPLHKPDSRMPSRRAA